MYIADKIYPLKLQRYQDTSTVVYGADNILLHSFLTQDDKWRLATQQAEVSSLYIDTLLAREDRFYYTHWGVNPFSMIRALYQAIRAGHIVSGGSTITMQTARLLVPHKRTLYDKWLECLRALQLEWHYSKKEILNMYLTLAPFGGNMEGLNTAALAYFNKTPTALSPAEIALCIAIVQSPNRLRPDRFADAAFAARNRILAFMAQQNLIDKNDLRYYQQTSMPNKINKCPKEIPHLAWRLKQQNPENKILQATIDIALQKQIEALLTQYQATMPPHANAAILIVDHTRHTPMVYIGSRGFIDNTNKGYIDYIQAYRSPGSTLKPFIYGLAFDLGLSHPERLIVDTESRFDAYHPHNIDKSVHGMISTKEALALSLNIPVVALLNEIGVVRFLALLKQVQVEPKFPKSMEKPSLPTALGGLSITLEQLVTLYAGLAQQGKMQNAQHLLSERAAQQITDILSIEMQNGSYIAMKTGTSYGHRDALVLGYDKQYVVGIWVGHPDGSPMGQVTGSSVAVPLLKKIFYILPKNSPIQMAQETPHKYMLNTFAQSYQDLYTPAPKLLFPVHASIITFMPGENPAIPCRITGGVRPYTWWVNGKLLATQWQSQFHWTPETAGYYTLTAIDAHGQSVKAQIEVQLGL